VLGEKNNATEDHLEIYLEGACLSITRRVPVCVAVAGRCSTPQEQGCGNPVLGDFRGGGDGGPGGGKGVSGLRVALDIRPLGMSSRYQGTGVYGFNLLRHLMRLDAETEFLLLQRKSRPWGELSGPANFQAWPVRRFHDQDQRFAPLLDQVLTPLDLYARRVHLYHALSVHYGCWRLPCPAVVTILDMIPLIFPGEYQRTGCKHRLLYGAARRAERILTPSEHARRDVHRLLGIPLERIRVTHFAADECFRPVEDPRQVDSVVERYGVKRPYLLYAGGFTQPDPRKNVMRLVEVFGTLRGEKGFENLSLVLAGRPGPYSDSLSREMRRSGLASGVVFPGHLEHETLRFFYCGASCFVFPSLYEGFGMPPLEAISCGTPTVAFRASCVPEILGEAAVLVDEKDPHSLLLAVRAVLTRKDLAAGLREQGFLQARRFRWENTARLTLETYREVLGRGRALPARQGVAAR